MSRWKPASSMRLNLPSRSITNWERCGTTRAVLKMVMTTTSATAPANTQMNSCMTGYLIAGFQNGQQNFRCPPRGSHG